ncbi:chromosome segregation ATPase [Geitlerinema sp. PCC 7407]|uniref:chromosome segregation ATPase n=1 Tax=Geitlerinema sp. PCC 7407 TaxID=1173025 RepID=UPI00123792C8|nr:chromosome segregation ATPase [Geitlerinema sp. PCC 7407]
MATPVGGRSPDARHGCYGVAMTKNPRLPDRWPPDSRPRAVGATGRGPRRPPNAGNSAQPPRPSRASNPAEPPTAGVNGSPSATGATAVTRRPRRLGWSAVAIAAILTTGGVGLLAAALMLRLPALPNCPSIFWPTASASMRLYCAQLAANKQTVRDFLEAIALVKDLPANHPLRPEIDRHIEEWAQGILDLGEVSFQEGKLSEAISTARRVPEDTTAAGLVQERIQQWQKTWSDAEEIYQNAEDFLRQEKWGEAFREAVRLLSVGNRYWETTKYNELNQKIQTARQDGSKLSEARRLADAGGVENLLKAIKLAESIGEKSYIYREARSEIKKFGRQMLDLAEAQLEDKNSTEALSIARRIPASAELQGEVEDFTSLAGAYGRAWEGTIAGLQDAIVQAQRIGPQRPLHGRAQSLITRWQLEIEDVARLDKAEDLALTGTVGALSSAIAEVSLIPQGNPRWQEAQEQISRWTSQIQTQEDQPYLDRAEQVAFAGDVESLQAAINEASQIQSGRALYDEAQTKIQTWRSQIQQTQDRPILDEARRAAQRGDINQAISVASQIQSGRALYDEAQGDIATWRAQIQGEQSMAEARRLAISPATPSSLAAAIRAAERVPANSQSRAEADAAIADWSQQILTLANDRASYDLPGAIAIAQQVPSGTPAYASAQSQIETWQSAVSEPPPPSASPETPAEPPVPVGP